MVDQLSSEFKGTMGYVRVYVSLHIHRDYELKLLYINQTWYIVQIIVKFGLAMHTVKTPSNPNVQLNISKSVS
jgi:hypothetical protein